MYLPAHFRQDDVAAMHAVIAAFPLATVITAGPDGILASHVPVLVEADPLPYGILRCHLARANEQWHHADGAEALVTFVGPEAYITPAWYGAKAETGRVVPTWNYVAVHARGVVRVFTDPGELRKLVARLTDHHEASEARPWSADDAPERFMHDQLLGIVGFEIPIRELRGKWKLSQNRTPADREHVIAGLCERSDPRSHELAAAMTDGGPLRAEP